MEVWNSRTTRPTGYAPWPCLGVLPVTCWRKKKKTYSVIANRFINATRPLFQRLMLTTRATTRLSKAHRCTDTQTRRHTEKQRQRQADRRADSQTDGPTDGQTDKQTDRHADTRTDGQTDGHTDRQTEHRLKKTYLQSKCRTVHRQQLRCLDLLEASKQNIHSFLNTVLVLDIGT